jgi:hypothetical protein
MKTQSSFNIMPKEEKTSILSGIEGLGGKFGNNF